MLVFLRHLGNSRNLIKVINGTYSTNTVVQRPTRFIKVNHLANVPFTFGTSARGYYGLPSTPPSLKSVLSKIDYDMGKRRRIGQEEAYTLIKAIENCISIHPAQSLKALKCFGKRLIDIKPEERIKMAQEVWSQMQRMKSSIDITHFNALLNVFLENEYQFSEEIFLKTIEDSQLEPNEDTYQMFLMNRARRGDMDGSLDIMATMQKKKYPLSPAIIRAAILCYGEQGNIESATSQIQKMPGIGLQPDGHTYASLLCVYAKYGDINSIIEQIQRCKSMGIEILPKFYPDVIYSLCVNGHSQHVHPLAKHIERGYELHQDIINVILQLTMKGMDKAAIEVLTSKSFYYADKSMYIERVKAFIRFLVKMKRPLANQLNNCEALAKSGLKHQAYLILVRAITDQGNTDDVLAVLRALQKRKVELSQGFFEHLFPANDTKAVELLNILKEEFSFQISAKFMRENVMPHLEMKDPISTVHAFRSTHTSQYASSTSVAYECLRRNRLKEAADVTTFFKTYLEPLVLTMPLISAVKHTKDFESYTKLVQNIHKNYEQPILDRSDDIEQKSLDESIGFLLYNTITAFPVEYRSVAVKKILPDFVSCNIKIAKNYADRIRKALGTDLSQQANTLLNYITADAELHSTNSESTLLPNEGQISTTTFTETKISNWNNFKPVYVTKLDCALKSNDINLLRKVFNNVRCIDRLSHSMLISLLTAFGNANLLDEAKQVTLQILQTNSTLSIPDLPGLLHKFGGKGDVEIIEKIGKHLSPKQKYSASYNVNLAYAYFTCDRGAELLDVLSMQLDKAKTEEEITDLMNSFPSRSLLTGLNRNIYLYEKFEILARKYAAKNVWMPYNILFCHYFIRGNMAESERIWNDYLKFETNFYYGPILTMARTKFNAALVQHLIKLLKDSDVHKGMLHVPYGCLLDIYMDNGMIDMALKTLEEARNHKILGRINKQILKRLKKATVSIGKTFSYDELLYTATKY